ncbi:YbjN domain-containing protein [Alteriqipengyuania sp. 357]
MRKLLLAAAVLPTIVTQAAAQSPPTMVGAHDPASLVSALEMGGYKAELDVDGDGDPTIRTEFAGMPSSIAFYGCDRDHAGCTSLMFVTGFDRDEEWDAVSAIEVSKKERFAAVWLDDEGDPWISWDVVTGRDGVPVGTFSTAVRVYAETVDRVANLVFAEERGG